MPECRASKELAEQHGCLDNGQTHSGNQLAFADPGGYGKHAGQNSGSIEKTRHQDYE
jgi:hypothetical protein